MILENKITNRNVENEVDAPLSFFSSPLADQSFPIQLPFSTRSWSAAQVRSEGLARQGMGSTGWSSCSVQRGVRCAERRVVCGRCAERAHVPHLVASRCWCSILQTSVLLLRLQLQAERDEEERESYTRCEIWPWDLEGETWCVAAQGQQWRWPDASTPTTQMQIKIFYLILDIPFVRLVMN
jgi:hypothetical protein